jgi:hypothetical protein
MKMYSSRASAREIADGYGGLLFPNPHESRPVVWCLLEWTSPADARPNPDQVVLVLVADDQEPKMIKIARDGRMPEGLVLWAHIETPWEER